MGHRREVENVRKIWYMVFQIKVLGHLQKMECRKIWKFWTKLLEQLQAGKLGFMNKSNGTLDRKGSVRKMRR